VVLCFLTLMTDSFSLLNQPRRPWLDAELLKEKYLTLSTSVHPDKIDPADEGEKGVTAITFSELNAAYACLTEPKSRLRHLLELELGAKPKDVQEIPPELADLFTEVATVCRSVDVFLLEKSRAISPLRQVQLFERAQQWIEQLNPLRKKLGNGDEQMKNELKSLDDAWLKADATARKALLKNVEELYRRFSYFNRWNGQVQERVTKLML
jgi:curved DNA-binding protein CbpA